MLDRQASCGSESGEELGWEVYDPRSARGALGREGARAVDGARQGSTPARAPVSMGIFGDAARPRGGDGRDRQSLGAAGGAAQTGLQGVQRGVPADLGGELRGRDPARASARTANIQQPALAAVVGQSADVIEDAHG